MKKWQKRPDDPVIDMKPFCFLNWSIIFSRLENEFQKDAWGTVEYHHTVEEEDLNAKVAALALFIRFTVEDIDSDPKYISKYVWPKLFHSAFTFLTNFVSYE